MHESWLSFPAGIIIASVASTVGIGGGILWMPFLLIILRIPPEKAIVTSLMIQTAGMGSGSLAFWYKKQIDPKLLLVLLPVTVREPPPVIVRSSLLKRAALGSAASTSAMT